MKRAAKSKAKGGAKRDLFAELSKGMEALADARQGKRTLRTHAVKYKPVPQVTPQDLIRVRKSLRISRALLRGPICGRTYAHWKTGNKGAPSQTRKPPY